MKPFVLVVDDSLSVRMDLRQAFVKANFAVMACGTLLTARQVLKNRSCDLAVLDLLLPDGNGSELLREIKADPEMTHIPVIILSSLAGSSPETRGGHGGADQYVCKPYDRSELVRLAESLCRANMQGKRFLIVDDSPTFANALSAQLMEYGNEVLLAASGEAALELLAHEVVDCVIIDMIMPGMSGQDTCRRIRQLPNRNEPAIVMMTASKNPSDRSQRGTVGADAFLAKSERFDRLCAQLHALLRKKGNQVQASVSG
jgi:DNA-binding response OmpR family regulator